MSAVKSVPNSIAHYNTISICQIYSLKKLPARITAATHGYTDQQIVHLRLKLHQLQISVDTYKPKWFVIILHLLTGTYLKICILRHRLPKIAFYVDQAAQKAILNTPSLASQLTPIKGQIIAQKIQLIDRAIACFKALPKAELQANEEMQLVAAKVDSYFQNVKSRLERGIDESIMWWHHATRPQYLDSIFRKGLKQYWAPCGIGLFASTQWEHSYGAYMFAIKEEALAHTEASFFLSGGVGGFPETYCQSASQSIWTCMYENCPINAQTIQFFVTADSKVSDDVISSNYTGSKQQISPTALAKLTAHLKKSNIPVMDGKTYCMILHCIDRANQRREIPLKWKAQSAFAASSPNLQHIRRPTTSWKSPGLSLRLKNLFF